jgi:hypothetical protein
MRDMGNGAKDTFTDTDRRVEGTDSTYPDKSHNADMSGGRSTVKGHICRIILQHSYLRKDYSFVVYRKADVPATTIEVSARLPKRTSRFDCAHYH